MRKHKMIYMFILASLLLALHDSASAQSDTAFKNKHKIGVAAAVQHAQQDLLVPIWISERIVVEPGFYFNNATGEYTDIGFGIAVRGTVKTGKAVPYFGGRIGMLRFSRPLAETVTDYIYGIQLGGEYFLDHHFSLRVEEQLNVAESANNSERFGNPEGTNINTATSLVATFYF